MAGDREKGVLLREVCKQVWTEGHSPQADAIVPQISGVFRYRLLAPWPYSC